MTTKCQTHYLYIIVGIGHFGEYKAEMMVGIGQQLWIWDSLLSCKGKQGS